MKYPYILLLVMLLGLGACNDKFGEIEYIHLTFEVDSSKLALPAHAQPQFKDATLKMFDYNRWGEVLTYSVPAVDAGIQVKRGYYNNVVFTAILQYDQAGQTVSIPVLAKINNTTDPVNMIKKEEKVLLPLERSGK